MPVTTAQIPLDQALNYTSPQLGCYYLKIPLSVCFGSVALGGFVQSFIHRAALDLVSKSPKSAGHRHVQQMSVQFLRPTLPEPEETFANLKTVSGNRGWTVLHVEVVQNGKANVVGHLMLTDLDKKGFISVNTGWELSPPSLPITVEALEADLDEKWVSYLTPYDPELIRRPQCYMKYYTPINRTNKNILDQWVTPGWKDVTAAAGAMWTDELLHFVIDNSLPLLNDLADATATPSLHDYLIQAGLAQRQARSENRDNRISGKGLGNSDLFPYIVSTLSISTEVKKNLPDKGTKWLFMRATSKCLKHDRMDMEVIMLDEYRDLVAVSTHVLQVIPVSKKGMKHVVEKPRASNL